MKKTADDDFPVTAVIARKNGIHRGSRLQLLRTYHTGISLSRKSSVPQDTGTRDAGARGNVL
ncbi:hypothetical protein [Nocardiopsis alborubida]|uniref:hypothetical protein n=1 Tax=Nocardiopsis alborubida TaxID=146802 RepID=UPI000AF6D939|nr:hypothetical protein [Nocardiopsis alborubida]